MEGKSPMEQALLAVPRLRFHSEQLVAKVFHKEPDHGWLMGQFFNVVHPKYKDEPINTRTGFQSFLQMGKAVRFDCIHVPNGVFEAHRELEEEMKVLGVRYALFPELVTFHLEFRKMVYNQVVVACGSSAYFGGEDNVGRNHFPFALDHSLGFCHIGEKFQGGHLVLVVYV